MTKITYSKVGDNYETKDPTKKLTQIAAEKTSVNLIHSGFEDIADTRGESAFVWEQGNVLMATVIEGLGTKNLVADAMQKITGKSYYDSIGYDTIATVINDLATVGAKPLVVHAYWAIENNNWLQSKQRMKDLISGWRKGCDDAGAAWGGGETPTLKGLLKTDTIELGGSAVGIIEKKEDLITDKKLQSGDQIIFLRSSGINANGLSLARSIAKKVPKGYATKLPSGKTYGESLLIKTNIYAKLIQTLLRHTINLHYISNITGHGLRKVMRSNRNFTYYIESVAPVAELFTFIQQNAHLSDTDMYGTYNMGMDYALFLPLEDVEKAQRIIKKLGFDSIHAGYIKNGERKVMIIPKNIVFSGKSLSLRI